MPVLAARIIAAQFRENLAERSGQFDERFVLLRREIILDQLFALDRADDWLGTGGTGDEVFSADSAGLIPFWNSDADRSVSVLFVPFIEHGPFAEGIGADISD